MANVDGASAGIWAYSGKKSCYFDGARLDFVAHLGRERCTRVLEIGCGNGGTGRAALQQGACAEYHAVELEPEAARKAACVLTGVACGDVEHVELPWSEGYFDALVMSEVLEHLVDPWTTLRRLATVLRPNALVLASSPNVANWRIIRMLVSGEWRLSDVGVMDRTHLRWFTPLSYRELFELAGFDVTWLGPVSPLGFRSRLLAALLLGRCDYLFWTQICVRARKR